MNCDERLYKEIRVEKEDLGSALMEKPFNPSLINIDIKSPTIDLLLKRLRAEPPEIDLYPEFQRSGDLWTEEQQSRLIESILIQFPLPVFYFDATNDDKWLIVDGLQRLSSLRNFMITKTLRLKGLEFLDTLEGKSFDELDRTYSRKIEEAQIVAYLIQPGTPSNVKFNIFRRINTGGIVLSPQEIRHALHQGKASSFVSRLAQSEAFKKATENKIRTHRMEDREFVTRFIAFYLNNPGDYTPDLDTFLNASMEKLETLKDEELKKIEKDFLSAMDLAHHLLGEWAFRKTDHYPKWRAPINKALFEIWAVNLARLRKEDKESLRQQDKGTVFQAFVKKLKEDTLLHEAITTGTGEKNKAVYRFKALGEFFTPFLKSERR